MTAGGGCKRWPRADRWPHGCSHQRQRRSRRAYTRTHSGLTSLNGYPHGARAALPSLVFARQAGPSAQADVAPTASAARRPAAVSLNLRW